MEKPGDFLLLPRPRSIVRTPGVSSIALDAIREMMDRSIRSQGYRLTIASTEIVLASSDAAGNWYGRQTLLQLRQIHRDALPCCTINDWPDFPARGVMLDVSRDKVPTMSTLYMLIDRLASWKINQVQLYIEHTFAYREHEEVWKIASPFTADEIQLLDRYCRERYIELVPNQNSFGHMERWLKHRQYLPLAESPNGAPTPWGFYWDGPFSLCPTEPKCLELLAGLYDELLPNFSSALFNVGCDETFDIGAGRSAEAVAARGVHSVYFDFLRQVHGLVSARGRRMMFWGDIIRRAPELIEKLRDQLPGAVAMVWDYEAETLFANDGRMFASAPVPFYVCPGTSSWCSIAGRTDVMIANATSAAHEGLKHGAIGYLMTDWGDYGHLQYLPISYAGFVAAAALSWCAESNEPLPLAALLDRYAFENDDGQVGRIALELGNVYQHTGKIILNGSPLFRIIVPHRTGDLPAAGMTLEGLASAGLVIDYSMRGIDSARPRTAEGQLVIDEFKAAAAQLRFAVRLGRAQLGDGSIDLDEHRRLITEHQRLWLARNRAGGLTDSVARLEGAIR